MLKPSLKNISLYILLKYFLFYVVLLFSIDDSGFIHPGEFKNPQYWFMHLWLFLPILNMIIFSAPLYFSFRLSGVCIIVALTAITIAEYFVHSFLASEKRAAVNGVYNGIISTIVLLLFFYKYIQKRVINP